MNNNDTNESSEFKTAAVPYTRTRFRTHASNASAAQMQPAPSAPPAESHPEQTPANPAPFTRRRSIEQPLTAPLVYDPSGRELRAPSVSPVQFNEDSIRSASHSKGRFVFISALLGALSGLFLTFVHSNNRLLLSFDVADYGEAGMLSHCLIWGVLIGILYSLILSPIHKKSSSSLPVYASLLFLPVLLFLAMPITCMGTSLLIEIAEAVIGIAGTAIALFLAWIFMCGG